MLTDTMEIEEVAAHNADAYNPGIGSAKKRKREKAQEQLRNRMRRRNNGTSSSMVSTRLKNSSQHSMGELTQVQGVKSVWNSVKNNSKDDHEWRVQEARYGALSHPDRVVVGQRKHRHVDVPLGELVDRVMQRRGHMTDSSPMTIRAIQPPAPPFAIQQPSLIRKMVRVQPINKRKPKSNGPYVVVLKRDSATNKSAPNKVQEPKDLPPLKQQNNSDDVEFGTWRPELATMHDPYIHPNAEDRSVTNYRLQMQQAIKIAELRGDFSTSTKPMHKHAPLPAIQVSYEVAENEQPVDTTTKMELEVQTATTEEKPQNIEQNVNQETVSNVTKDSNVKSSRFTSSEEVLHQMQARKQAKRRKVKGDDFKNPLRTRSRYTAKSKQFKEDLTKVRELSIIQEDQSSISERLSRLSAGRTSVASFQSVSSLKRIEEAEVPGYPKIKHQPGKSRGAEGIQIPPVENSMDSRSSANNNNMQSQSENDLSCHNRAPSPTEFSSNNDISDSKAHNEIKSDLAPSDPNTIKETTTGKMETETTLTMLNDESNQASSVIVTAAHEINQNMVWIPGDESCSPDHDLDFDAPNNPLTLPQNNCQECQDSERTSQSQVDDSNESKHIHEKPTTSEEDSLVIRESINQQSVDRYGEADSHQGIPALETFDRRDVILPAETVK